MEIGDCSWGYTAAAPTADRCCGGARRLAGAAPGGCLPVRAAPTSARSPRKGVGFRARSRGSSATSHCRASTSTQASANKHATLAAFGLWWGQGGDRAAGAAGGGGGSQGRESGRRGTCKEPAHRQAEASHTDSATPCPATPPAPHPAPSCMPRRHACTHHKKQARNQGAAHHDRDGFSAPPLQKVMQRGCCRHHGAGASTPSRASPGWRVRIEAGV